MSLPIEPVAWTACGGGSAELSGPRLPAHRPSTWVPRAARTPTLRPTGRPEITGQCHRECFVAPALASGQLENKTGETPPLGSITFQRGKRGAGSVIG